MEPAKKIKTENCKNQTSSESNFAKPGEFLPLLKLEKFRATKLPKPENWKITNPKRITKLLLQKPVKTCRCYNWSKPTTARLEKSQKAKNWTTSRLPEKAINYNKAQIGDNAKTANQDELEPRQQKTWKLTVSYAAPPLFYWWNRCVSASAWATCWKLGA